MSKDELQQSLDALKAEIENLQEGEDDVRQRLSELVQDVEAKIDDPDEGDAETVTERVSHFVEQMEIEHPITETLNRFLTALGEIGI